MARRARSLILAAACTAGLATAEPVVQPEVPGSPFGRGSYVEHNLGVAGANRLYGRYEPPEWRPGSPVVVMLHGFGGSAADARLYGMERVADREGLLLAYASGPAGEWNIGANYRNASTAVQGRDDIGYLDRLLDELAGASGARTPAVYLVGNSMGGLMAVTYACARSERVAGIAAVISGMTSGQLASCRPGRPVPFALLIGSADRLLPPFNGRDHAVQGVDGSMLWLASFDESLEFWARANGCNASFSETNLPRRKPDDPTSIVRRDFGECRGAGVVGYRFEGMGHRWPGMMRHPREADDPLLAERLGPPSGQADGAELIWDFFERSRAAAR